MLKKIKKKNIEKEIDAALAMSKNVSKSKKIKRVGFLFDGDVFDDLAFKKHFLKQIDVSVDNAIDLSFVTFDKKMKPLPKTHFSNKDISWRGNIISKQVQDFTNQNFDALVCYYEHKHPYLDLLTAKSKASFKIGLSSKSQRFFDLLINVPLKDTSSFTAEAKKYLSILGKI